MTYEAKRVLFLIRNGSENAITRSELVWLTGYDDRKLRKIIELLKDEYHIINSNQGYYIPRNDEVEKIKEYKAKCKSRALKELEHVRHLEALIEDIEKGRLG